MTRLPFYDHIKLTPEEEEEAILQGKIKKYFKTKNAPYWEEKENGKRTINDPEDIRKHEGERRDVGVGLR